MGRRIVELLCERGDEVRFLARGAYPEVTKATGAVGIQADLRDFAAVQAAVEGCEAVFHAAAKPGYWGKREEFWSINVDGTRNVVDALEQQGAGKLIYTSTPSVVGYADDVAAGAQDLPYAAKHESFYPESKAAAEQVVLAANGTLATVALRPHLIFGPGDVHLLPRVVDRARNGKLAIVGDGLNRVDMTYVDNAAWAHLDALDALSDAGADCAGKAYFISNDEPVLLWAWINRLLERLDVPTVERRISLATATRVGAVMAWVWRTFALSGEPRMTPFVAAGLARAHWYDMAPAKRDIGYRVRVDMASAMGPTVRWLGRD